MSGLLDVAQAEARVLGHAGDFGTEIVPLEAAACRVLRQAVHAERALPPYDRVMMDGIAVRLKDVYSDFRYEGLLKAGSEPVFLKEDDGCIEVMTGCVLPLGADTVIPVERIVRSGERCSLERGYLPQPGQFVHRAGSDCAAGTLLLSSGARLNAPALAVLAANGYAAIEVSRVPSIGIVSTGDELVDVDMPVRDWEIRRSNEYALTGALMSRGFTALERSVIADDLDRTVRVLGDQLERHDVVIVSGGVSMGAFDHVPQALERLGVTRVFHKVAQKPGKPLWFGVGPKGQRVFGLPGNPVSATTCGVRYVVPHLLAAQKSNERNRSQVVLAEEAEQIPTLARFLPVSLRQGDDGRMLAMPRPMSTSGDFSHLASTDGFLELESGEGIVPAGALVTFHGW